MSQFFKDLLERALKTFVHVFLVTFAAGVDVLDTINIDTVQALLAGAAGAGVSAVMSLLSKGVGNPDNASLVK